MTKLTYFRFDLNILILLVFIVIAFFNFNEINSFSENKLDSHIDLDKSILPTFQNKNQDLIKNRFFYLELNKMSIPINFFSIQDNLINNVIYEKDKNSLILILNPTNFNNNSLIIDLPRSIINAKNQDNKDNNFTVLLDNKSSKYLEIHDKKNLDKILNPIYNINTIGNTFDNANDRELLIQFDKDTKVIKIIGSNMSRDQNQIQIHSFYKYNFIIPIILPITITISLILIYVFYKKKKKNFTNLFKYKRDKNNKEK